MKKQIKIIATEGYGMGLGTDRILETYNKDGYRIFEMIRPQAGEILTALEFNARETVCTIKRNNRGDKEWEQILKYIQRMI